MDWWIYVVILLVIVIVAQAFMEKSSAPKEVAKEADTKKIHYESKPFITKSEKSFLATLRELSKHGYIVIPQVNLATVVKKVGEFRYQNELYRNIDFGVFDREYNLLLLIELNDASHQQNSRRARDVKVREIVSQAGIEIITFYTNKPNRADYVIVRVLEKIKPTNR